MSTEIMLDTPPPYAPCDRRVVLVVDDDPTIRKWLTRLLDVLDYEVLAVEDCATAETMLRGSRFDAVILDVRLQAHSGLDLLAFIRGRSELASLPVVMLTGITDLTEYEQESIRRHGAYVFYKPAAVSELHATLTRAFAGTPTLS